MKLNRFNKKLENLEQNSDYLERLYFVAKRIYDLENAIEDENQATEFIDMEEHKNIEQQQDLGDDTDSEVVKIPDLEKTDSLEAVIKSVVPNPSTAVKDYGTLSLSLDNPIDKDLMNRLRKVRLPELRKVQIQSLFELKSGTGKFKGHN